MFIGKFLKYLAQGLLTVGFLTLLGSLLFDFTRQGQYLIAGIVLLLFLSCLLSRDAPGADQ